MRARFVDRPALPTALNRVAETPSVNGVAVLVADEGPPLSSALDETLRELSVPVFGGLFPQVLYDGQNHETGAVVVGLPTEPDVTVVSDLSDPASVDEFRPPDPPADGTSFVFVDAYAEQISRFIDALFRNWGVDIGYIGGGAGSLDDSGPCLLSGDGVVEDAAVVATADLSATLGVRHGWETVAGPLEITAASARTIEELDGERAFDVYSRLVEADAGTPVDAADFFSVAKSYPFGLSRIRGEKVVRDPYEVTDDGALRCFGDVPEGRFVHILWGDTESLVAAAEAAYDEAATGGDGSVLFFDCVSRVLFLEDQFGAELDAVGGDDDPLFGALTIGEVANGGEGHLEYYNKTAVAAVVENG